MVLEKQTSHHLNPVPKIFTVSLQWQLLPVAESFSLEKYICIYWGYRLILEDLIFT